MSWRADYRPEDIRMMLVLQFFTMDVVAEHLEFAERKKIGNGPIGVDADGFMQIPDDIDKELPFK